MNIQTGMSLVTYFDMDRTERFEITGIVDVLEVSIHVYKWYRFTNNYGKKIPHNIRSSAIRDNPEQ